MATQIKTTKTPDQIAYRQGQQAAQDGLDWNANPYSDFSRASRSARAMWAAGFHGK